MQETSVSVLRPSGILIISPDSVYFFGALLNRLVLSKEKTMALSKTARIWTIVVSIPVALIILLLLGLKLYFNGDRLRAMIVPRLEEATHRHISIKEISLDVFPSIAVSIDSLRISNPEGTRFDRDEFVSLNNLSINLKLLPLFTGTISIGEISVDHPTVYMEVKKDGSKNYATTQGAARRAEQGGTSGSLGAGLLISDLRIKDGTVEFVNNKFDSRMLFQGINEQASVHTTSGGQTISIEQTTSIDKLSYGSINQWYLSDQPLKSTSRISYALDKDLLTLEDVKGQIRDLPITVSGNISRLKEDVNMMDITVASPGATMEQLLSLIPPELLRKTEGLKASGDVQFSATIKGPSGETIDPATSANFSVTNGAIQYASLPKSISGVTIHGTFEKPSAPVTATGGGSLTIDRYGAHVGSNDLGGSLKVTGFDDPQVAATFKGVLDLAEVKDFYPLQKGSNFGGTVKADISVQGKAKKPESMNGTGQIELRGVTVQSAGSAQPVRNLNGTIAFNRQAIESKQLGLTIGESDLNLGFSLRNYLALLMPQAEKAAGKPSATVKLTSHQLRTADLMGESQPPAAKSDKPAAARQGGLVPGIDLDADVSIDKLVTDKFTFSNARGLLGISNGVVNMKSFTINAFNGTVQTKGTLDLRDEKKRPFDLDLAIKDVESNELLSPFTSFGKYLFGKLTMNTKLKGDLNDTLGLDPKTLTGDGLAKVMEGKLVGLPITQKLAEFTGASRLKEVDFKDWTNSFSVADGRCLVKDLKVNAGTTALTVDGSQGFDGSLDYALTVKLPPDESAKINLPGVANELVQFLKDKDGRLTLPFHVGGTAGNPTLQLNTAAQEELAKKALQDKTQQQLKNKLEEGLKKLFKKP